MKKLLPFVLVLLLLCGCATQPVETVGTTTAQTSPPTTTAAETTEQTTAPEQTVSYEMGYGTCPVRFDPFLYSQSPILSEMLAGWNVDTAACTLGYLYALDWRDDVLISVSDCAIVQYWPTQQFLFYLTEDGKVYQSTYDAAEKTLIYSCDPNNAFSLDYFDAALHITDGDQLIRYDLYTCQTETVTQFPGLRQAFGCPNGYYILRGSDGKDTAFDPATNKTAPIPSEWAATMLRESGQWPE